MIQLKAITVALICLLFLSTIASAQTTIEGRVVTADYEPAPATIKIFKGDILTGQAICSENGTYNLKISPGDYKVLVSYLSPDGTIYMSETTVSISGNSTFDFKLYPILTQIPVEDNTTAQEIESLQTFSQYMDEDLYQPLFEEETTNSLVPSLSIITILIGCILAIAVLRIRKSENTPDLPTDELSLYNMIKEKGIIEQRELTERSGFSAAKVSMVLSSMEERGIIEREKVGRNNIVKIRNSR